MPVQYILNKNSAVIVTEDENKVYAGSTPEYEQVKNIILTSNDVETDLYDFVNSLKKTLENVYEGFTVENDIVFIDGEALPGLLGQRLKQFADAKAPYQYLLKFWANLKKNPSYRSVNTLFNFLENTHCPIDENGYIQCFKGVTSEFKDKHTGKIDNSPGNVVKLERRLISDDPDTACHFGLHAGSLKYVKGFINGYSDKIVEVLVNPAHVVCVPNDCSFGKMRVEEYKVVKEVPTTVEQPTSQIYKEEFDANFDVDDDDEEWDTDDYEYDWEDEDEEWDDHEDDWDDGENFY